MLLCYLFEYSDDMEEMLSVDKKSVVKMQKSLLESLFIKIELEKDYLELFRTDFRVLYRVSALTPCNDFNSLEKECQFSDSLSKKIHKIYNDNFK